MCMRAFLPRRRAAWVLALLAGAIAGCGGGASPSLDEAVGRTSLTSFLDAWKKGDRPEALKQQFPSIIVGDSNWNGGARLVSYQIGEPVTHDGSNLHASVELELEDGAGQRMKQNVVYIVGTSPEITIFPE